MKIVAFLKDIKKETKKINWPDKKKVLKYTFIVIGISIGVAVFLGASDFVFNILLRKLILK